MAIVHVDYLDSLPNRSHDGMLVFGNVLLVIIDQQGPVMCSENRCSVSISE